MNWALLVLVADTIDAVGTVYAPLFGSVVRDKVVKVFPVRRPTRLGVVKKSQSDE